jgi:threonyl-tRNA synthetase
MSNLKDTYEAAPGKDANSINFWRSVIRHSCAHVMAQAVCEMFPGTKLAIGPAIENGFYYDFLIPNDYKFNEEDLVKIEEKMKEIVKQDLQIKKIILSKDEALNLFCNQPFKLEIINSLGERKDELVESEVGEDNTISIYKNGEAFFDLCKGPHVSSTGILKAFRLTKSSASYWRGDEKNASLQRIYGIAFESKEELDKYLEFLRQAELRDHRRLGSELDMFHFPKEIGGGLPVFHPKGGILRYLLEDYSRKRHLQSGYEPVWTPHLAKSDLFETSGHLGFYKESMYPQMELENSQYYVKPMNCPFHILIYRSKLRSYKDLPLRYYELGTVYRNERSGVLHGLARVRSLTQDDSHIFCTPEQLESEIIAVIKFMLDVLKTFGLSDFEAELSTRPDKYVGELYQWEEATKALVAALESSGIKYEIAEKQGAFYAPKIDIHLKDAIGRKWQVSTVQVDLQSPARFSLEYVTAENERKAPYMIHRALFGSVERFIAILMEHFAGNLPLWLSPVQVKILPVKEANYEYANSLFEKLLGLGIRAEISRADEGLNPRIRDAKLQKIPYILVAGDRDANNHTVGVNTRGSGKPAFDIPISKFFEELTRQVNEKTILLFDFKS